MPIVGQKIETTSDNFAYMVRSGSLLIDKSLMIKDFLSGQQVSLITRSRRSGKSLNISMLHNFLAAEVFGEPTAGLFDKFAIASEDDGEFLKQHQGKYPVICIAFKDIKESSYPAMLENIKILIVKLYRAHEAQLASDRVSSATKTLFEKYLSGTVSEQELSQSLSFLSEFLCKTFDKKVIILIDEYDSPLTHAYQHNFLDKMSDFMRNMFSSALKSNPFLEKGLMSGILRVSKNDLLSGLNNLKIYSVFDHQYSHYFGFTEAEVIELTTRVGSNHRLEEIRRFYNGYIIGETVIYNPWSLMNYLYEKKLSPYWILTSGDTLLKDLFLNSNAEQKDQFSKLMQGNSVTANVSLQTRYEELMEEPDALWTLLLFSGYLTVVSFQQERGHFICELKIPNEEILSQYQDIFSCWLKKHLGGNQRYNLFLSSLFNGEVDKFTAILGDYLLDSLSFRDIGEKKAENFYHGFVAGLIASVRETHWVDSNKESGHGLYDIILTPKAGYGTRGVILEFKHAKKTESLAEETKKALAQIDESEYATILARYPHVTHVLKVGLAFSGKAAQSIYREENLITHEHSALVWTTRCVREVDDEEFTKNMSSSSAELTSETNQPQLKRKAASVVTDKNRIFSKIRTGPPTSSSSVEPSI
jgi:hypothetical protein